IINNDTLLGSSNDNLLVPFFGNAIVINIEKNSSGNAPIQLLVEELSVIEPNFKGVLSIDEVRWREEVGAFVKDVFSLCLCRDAIKVCREVIVDQIPELTNEEKKIPFDLSTGLLTVFMTGS
ncbi:MAG: hypothetical protein AAGA31_16910, partial [Bacteroidota bacterium]